MLPPCSELVSMVNGHASIAAHVHPINRKGMKRSHGLEMKATPRKPMAPSTRLSEYENLRLPMRGRSIAQITLPTACTAKRIPTQSPAAL